MKKVLLCLLITVAVFLGLTMMINYATPGDESDPIITKSYLDTFLSDKLKSLIDTSAVGSSFEVVDIAEGKQIICEAGTELILRKGSGVIIATEKGGIANVTSGVDLPSGETVPANSLLIVPVADGRGFVATSEVIVMVKGGYVIEDYSPLQ